MNVDQVAGRQISSKIAVGDEPLSLAGTKRKHVDTGVVHVETGVRSEQDRLRAGKHLRPAMGRFAGLLRFGENGDRAAGIRYADEARGSSEGGDNVPVIA